MVPLVQPTTRDVKKERVRFQLGGAEAPNSAMVTTNVWAAEESFAVLVAMLNKSTNSMGLLIFFPVPPGR